MVVYDVVDVYSKQVNFVTMLQRAAITMIKIYVSCYSICNANLDRFNRICNPYHVMVDEPLEIEIIQKIIGENDLSSLVTTGAVTEIVKLSNYKGLKRSIKLVIIIVGMVNCVDYVKHLEHSN